MNHPTSAEYDLIICGGGIAGLWTLARLRQAGYRALLLEANALGAGQTILSQGIIHGGTKYAVEQLLSPIAKQLKTMPARWLRCLQGKGEIDLSGVNCLSPQQYLWLPDQLGNQLLGFLASKAMQSRVKKLKPAEFPAPFHTQAFHGNVYALNEPVLDVYTLLSHLREQHKSAILKINKEETHYLSENNQLKKIVSGHLELTAQCYLFTAGEFNESILKQFQFSNIETQRRPLQMLLIKPLPFPIYAHCVDRHFKPRLTLTSYPLAEGGYAWYIGGEVAEKGAAMTPEAVFHDGKKTLKKLLPFLDFDHVQWKTQWINRAEPAHDNGKIPPAPHYVSQKNVIVAWPVKLAYAPLLGDLLLKAIQTSFSPSQAATISFHDAPEVALPPWKDLSPWN